MKTEKIRKAKGSVLFTVVAVMTLLVVFMAGTMILVSSANHRSHINYSTAQTTVTARTVAESVLEATKKGNTDYDNYFFSVSKDNPITIPVSINGSDVANLGTMGHIDDVVVSYEGTMQFYGSEEDEKAGAKVGWNERDVIKVLANVNLGRTSSSSAIYLVVDPPSGDPSKSGNGAGFVTTGGAAFACQTSLYGGSYINIPSLESVNATNEGKGYDYDDPDHKYWSGNQTGETDQGTHLVVSIDNSGGVIEADSVINGSLKMTNFNGFIYPAKGKGVTIWGDMNFSSNSSTHFNTFINKKNYTGSYNFNELPYLYVDGAITGAGIDLQLKDTEDSALVSDLMDPAKSDPFLNIFCDTLNLKDTEGVFNVTGDIYCMGSGKTSYITANNGANLHDWTASVINKTISADGNAYVAGNLFSKGNVVFQLKQKKSIYIDGDVRIEGDLDLSKMAKNETGNEYTKLEIGGDLVVGGHIIDAIKENLIVHGQIYYDPDPDHPEYDLNGFESALRDGYMQEAEVDPKYKKVSNVEGKWIKWDLNTPKVESDVAEFTYDGSTQTITRRDTKTGKSVTYDSPVSGGTMYLATSVNGLYYKTESEGNSQYEFNGKRDLFQNMYSQITYYVECDKDGNVIGTEPITEPCWYYLNGDEHLSEAKVATMKYYKIEGGEKGAEVPAREAVQGGVLTTDDYKYDHIYPEYAEKRVLLGLKQLQNSVNGELLPTSETQVVKTMKDILETVVDPYANKGFPSTMTKFFNADGSIKYDQFENGNTHRIFKSIDQILAEDQCLCKTNIGGISSLTIPELEYDNSCTKTYDELKQDGIKGSVTITDSCVIQAPFSTGNYKDICPETLMDKGEPKGVGAIVVRPKNDMVIAIDGDVSIDNYSFIIDDTTGKKVYFYITPGSKLTLASSGSIRSVKYSALIHSKTPFQVVTDENLKNESVTAKTLKELGYSNPDVFIYGGHDSALELANFTTFVGNIISPELAVKFGSTNMDGAPNTIYYNGTNVDLVDKAGKWLMFGCCNAENADFPNKMKVIYTPDTGVTKKSYETKDRSHWLQVLYYDEY